MKEENKSQEWDFDKWTTLELYYHLIDMGLIPYEEKYDDWRFLKDEMLRMCKESIKNQENDTRST